MTGVTCFACARPATHRRRLDTGLVAGCAFHAVHPTATHPFDVGDDPSWPHATASLDPPGPG